MRAQLRRRLFLIVLAVLVLAALVYGFLPRPQQVEVAAVAAGPMQVTVEEEAKTRILDRYVISAPVAGFARRVDLDVGDALTRGEPLVVLEPLRSAVLDPRTRAEAQARVSAAEASLQASEQQAQAAKAEATYAQRDYERLSTLYQTQRASEDARDQARARYDSARAQQRSAEAAVRVARYQLEAARTALSYSAAQHTKQADETLVLRSPIDGAVLQIMHQSEGVVSPGEGLVALGNPQLLEVKAEVLSEEAVKIKPGMRVLFERWGGGPPLEGRVRTVEPVAFTKVSALGVEEQRVNVISDIVSDRALWQGLGDGYRVDARFILWAGDAVLQVPNSALFHAGQGWAAFVVEDGRARRRAVTLGRRNGLAAQVTDGLHAGERVITHPDDTVHDGVAVAVD